MIEVLKKKEIFTNTVEEGIGGNDKASYNHVYAIEIPIPEFSEIGYKEALSQALNTYFWNHNNKFLIEAQAAFDEVSKEG